MTRRAAGGLLVLVVVLAMGVASWRLLRRPTVRGLAPAPDGPASFVPKLAATAERPFILYFPGPNGRLYPETRDLVVGDEPAARVVAVVTALLAGPASPGLEAPLPPGVTLAGAMVGGDATAFLDLRSGEGVAFPAGGSRREMQVVYSFVESVVRGVPEVRRVVLLWNGAQPLSLAGHLDLGRPLSSRSDLVADSP